MTKPRGPRGQYATRLKAAYAAIVARLEAGASSRDVAREFECDKDTVNAIRRRYQSAADGGSR
jgi:transposase-like protein